MRLLLFNRRRKLERGTRVSLMIGHDVKSAPPGTDQVGDIISLQDIAAILPVGRHA
jgi:hypothetical protein